MDEYVELAKRTIREYIENDTIIDTSGVSEELLSRRAGTFVSIHKKDGNLRGCIGTIGPVRENVADEIISNAISASTKDPRFAPIGKEELSDLVINVDVLSEPERVNSIDELDAKKYGVIVVNGIRRGVLLPDLEGVDTPQEQIGIAMQKAGIYSDEEIELYRFEVVRHE